MSYKILIDRPARKFIERQPPDQQKRILAAIYKLPKEGGYLSHTREERPVPAANWHLSGNLQFRKEYSHSYGYEG